MEYKEQVSLSSHGVMRFAQIFRATGLNKAQIDETIGKMVKENRSEEDFHYPSYGLNANRKF